MFFMSQEIRRQGKEIWIFDDAEAYGSDRQYRWIDAVKFPFGEFLINRDFFELFRDRDLTQENSRRGEKS